MITRALALATLTLLAACAPARSPSAEAQAAPTENDACARYCDRLATCSLAPSDCAKACERDRANMRDGVYPSLVGCVERELTATTCGVKDMHERRGTLSLCWAATIDAYEKRDGGQTLKIVVRAVCGRQARCNPDGGATKDACSSELETKLAGKAQGQMLAVAKPEQVAALAACVETASCDAPDPVAACRAKQENAAP